MRRWMVAVFALVLAAGSGCINVDLSSLLEPKLQENTVREARGWTSNKLLLVDLRGVIASGSVSDWSPVTRCSPDYVAAVLRKAEQDPRIKGVVLAIDSPGGEVTASDLIYHEVLAFRARTGLPVHASILGLGASGGYYIACAADRIYVHPTSVTGSIGVIARFPRLVKLADKIGYEQRVFKSGELKDMGDPFGDMQPEEAAVLQKLVDTMFARFLTVVAAGRQPFASVEAVRPLADGRVYLAEEAVQLGLADQVLYLDGAIDLTMAAAGIADAKVIAYRYRESPDATVYSGATAASLPLSRNALAMTLETLGQSQKAGFYYLWAPGEAP